MTFRCRYCPCQFETATDYKSHLRKYNPNPNLLNLPLNMDPVERERIIEEFTVREHLACWLREVRQRK